MTSCSVGVSVSIAALPRRPSHSGNDVLHSLAVGFGWRRRPGRVGLVLAELHYVDEELSGPGVAASGSSKSRLASRRAVQALKVAPSTPSRSAITATGMRAISSSASSSNWAVVGVNDISYLWHHTRPGAFPRGRHPRRFRWAPLRRACPIGDRVAAFGSLPPFSVSAGRRALLNSGLPEDSISFCLGVFLESGDNIQLAFKLF
jgi:hypothetical protein